MRARVAARKGVGRPPPIRVVYDTDGGSWWGSTNGEWHTAHSSSCTKGDTPEKELMEMKHFSAASNVRVLRAASKLAP
eukprot:gene40149-24150_t